MRGSQIINTFSPEEVLEMHILMANGVSYAVAAERFNCSTWAIGQIVRHGVRTDVTIPEPVMDKLERRFGSKRIEEKTKKATNGGLSTRKAHKAVSLGDAINNYLKACAALKAADKALDNAKDQMLQAGANGNLFEALDAHAFSSPQE